MAFKFNTLIKFLLYIASPCHSLTTQQQTSTIIATSKARNHPTTRIFQESQNTDLSLSNKETKNDQKTHIIFPGGGIFFYWQAGVMTYLREKNYNLLNDDNRITFTGASAGALCATLTTANVDFERATELALSKAGDAGIWDRPLGLAGVWGEIIYDWLDELLPENSVELTQDKLSLLVTEIPSFSTNKISQFDNKKDLIRCNMASVHIPLFLDGKLTTDFRSKPHIDGSFNAKPEDYHKLASLNGYSNFNNGNSNGNSNSNDDEDALIFIDWQKDPILSDRTLSDAVTALSKEGIWDLLERGRSYAALMEKRGDFERLIY